MYSMDQQELLFGQVTVNDYVHLVHSYPGGFLLLLPSFI